MLTNLSYSHYALILNAEGFLETLMMEAYITKGSFLASFSCIIIIKRISKLTKLNQETPDLSTNSFTHYHKLKCQS